MGSTNADNIVHRGLPTNAEGMRKCWRGWSSVCDIYREWSGAYAGCCCMWMGVCTKLCFNDVFLSSASSVCVSGGCAEASSRDVLDSDVDVDHIAVVRSSIFGVDEIVKNRSNLACGTEQRTDHILIVSKKKENFLIMYLDVHVMCMMYDVHECTLRYVCIFFVLYNQWVIEKLSTKSDMQNEVNTHEQVDNNKKAGASSIGTVSYSSMTR